MTVLHTKEYNEITIKNPIHIYEFERRGEYGAMAVKSAERVLMILEYLLGFPNGLTAKEISRHLEIAPSSTHELLKTLSDRDYLIEDESKRYSLGPKLIQLGSNASSYFDINKIAVPILKQIMEELEETVFMAILSQNEVTYVAKINSNNTMATNASLGSRKPIYCTGLGKAFLAFMPEQESEKIINKLDFVPFTENTVKDRDELKSQLKTFRSQGYAVDDEEIEEGLYCIAVPVYDATYHMAVAISVSGLKPRMLNKKNRIIESLLRLSERLSRKLCCETEKINI